MIYEFGSGHLEKERTITQNINHVIVHFLSLHQNKGFVVHQLISKIIHRDPVDTFGVISHLTGAHLPEAI